MRDQTEIFIMEGKPIPIFLRRFYRKLTFISDIRAEFKMEPFFIRAFGGGGSGYYKKIKMFLKDIERGIKKN
jgi:hypothetical protein